MASEYCLRETTLLGIESMLTLENVGPIYKWDASNLAYVDEWKIEEKAFYVKGLCGVFLSVVSGEGITLTIHNQTYRYGLDNSGFGLATGRAIVSIGNSYVRNATVDLLQILRSIVNG